MCEVPRSNGVLVAKYQPFNVGGGVPLKKQSRATLSSFGQTNYSGQNEKQKIVLNLECSPKNLKAQPDLNGI